MPFKSEAQRRYLFVHDPKLAKEWAHKYGTPKDLPYKVDKHYRGANRYRRKS